MSTRTLDRVVEFDSRSWAFPVRDLIEEVKQEPKSYLWGDSTFLDQGKEGACVGFSWSGKLAASPLNVIGITNETAKTVYNTAKTLDERPGEDYSGTSVLAGVKALQQLYPDVAKEYKWAFGIDDLVLALGYVGPVVLGINWYSGMFTPNSEGVITVEGTLAGGHAILARGVDVENRRIRLRNSWGSSWGLNGDCFVSFDGIDRLLHEQGEACILL